MTANAASDLTSAARIGFGCDRDGDSDGDSDGGSDSGSDSQFCMQLTLGWASFSSQTPGGHFESLRLCVLLSISVCVCVSEFVFLAPRFALINYCCSFAAPLV